MNNLMAIDPIAIKIGPLTVAWYGLIIVSAMALAIYLSVKEAERRGISEDFIVDMAFWALPIGIIGARIYYVLFELDTYLSNPIKMFYIWEGGIAIYGGIIAGLLTVYYFSKKEKKPLLLVTDILAPYLLLAQSIGRWGNFINQEAHGSEVSRQFLEKLMLPEFIIQQMKIGDFYYHPTFLYESVWNLIGVFLLILLRNKTKKLLRGETTANYMIWYGIGRFFIEGMRTDSLYIGSLRVSQMLSLAIVLGGVALIVYERFFVYPKPAYYVEGMQPEIRFEKKKSAYQKNKK